MFHVIFLYKINNGSGADAPPPGGALAAAAAAQLEGVTVGAFCNGGVLLVCADPDHVQGTQVAASVVVLALLYGTLNMRVLFHFVHPSFFILFASEQS